MLRCLFIYLLYPWGFIHLELAFLTWCCLTPTTFDKIFGSWHGGSKESLQAQKQRWRERRR